ncbi:MAG: MATE family efflux transporter [Hominimerdicola sp.]
MEQVKENKMGTLPVNKLLISMSLPIMISMLVQALYNIVDSIFVAKISENALTAVSLAFPIQNLMIALGAGTGVGINALLSKSLGEKNYEQANKAANNGIFLVLINFFIFLLFGLFFTDIFYASQTNVPSIDPENAVIIQKYGKEYMSVICLFSVGLFAQITFERLLQATGKTIYSMYSQGAGAIINIILDPCLIFGVGFFPKMGVTGAAVATIIGQFCAAILGLFLNVKFNKELTVNPIKYKPDGRIIKKIYAVGLPSIIMQSIGSVMTYTMNKILMGFSTTAVAVFGVYFKLQSFIFMPIFGINNGLIPIIAYNFGARKKSRILKAMKLAIMYAVAIMAVGVIVMQVCPEALLKLFEADENMLSIGVPALRIISLHFVIAGASIIITATFQALSHGIFSMIISITRQLVVLLPAAYIFAKLGGVNAIWWCFPLAEAVSLTLCLVFFKRIKRTQIDVLEN